MSKQPISENELMMMIRQLNISSESSSKVVPLSSSAMANAEPTRIAIQNVIWIADNKIRTSYEKPNGPYPYVEPAEGTIVMVNGKAIAEATPVGPEDVVEWSVKEKPLFEITVSDDQIAAHLTVRQRERYGWKLVPTTPSRHLTVTAEPDPSIVLESIDIGTVMKALSKLGITKNIRTDALYEALFGNYDMPLLVAEGLKPVPSEDARLELYFSEHIERTLREVNGQVDFRNMLHIPSASKGDVIARKILPKPGIPGYNVYGELLRPEPPKDIFIVAKSNVQITDEGDVIALKDGRPRITGDRIKFFDIAPAYVVPGDVDLKTGNIVFAGDIVIYGNITDGMIVESLGNVYVQGNVYKSTVTATGSVVVRGNTVNNSNLYSGYFGVKFNRLYIALKEMLDQLQQFSGALSQLLAVLERRGMDIPLHQAAMTMMETKFRDLSPAARELEQSIFAVIQLNSSELEEVASLISVFTRPIHLIHLKHRGQLDTIIHRIQEAFLMIERHQESDAFIDLPQANSSTLMATGHVMVRREGVVQTDIHSKGNIMFQDMNAACRGGMLDAEGSIHAGSVGAETGVHTTLRAGKRISANKIHNCLVHVGRFKKTLLSMRYDFEAYIDKEEFITRGTDQAAAAEQLRAELPRGKRKAMI